MEDHSIFSSQVENQPCGRIFRRSYIWVEKKGLHFFQLNTNGIRLAQEAGYARKLKKAGLNTVFLQFDGVTDDVYQTLRGRSMIELKEKAVLNCSEAELGIALVPVIAPGVNDMQVGDILKFAMDHMPFVRGVHFQPISYFGRCSQQRPQAPITIPKMLKLIEEQTDGLMKSRISPVVEQRIHTVLFMQVI